MVALLLEHVACELVREGFFVVGSERVALVSHLFLCTFLEFVGIAIMKVSVVVAPLHLTHVFFSCCFGEQTIIIIFLRG